MRISDWSSDVCSSDLEKRSAAVSASQTRSDNLSTTYSIFGLIILVGALGMGWAANAALSDRRSASRLAEAESLRADDLEAAVTERTLELKDANERLQQEAAERAQIERAKCRESVCTYG